MKLCWPFGEIVGNTLLISSSHYTAKVLRVKESHLWTLEVCYARLMLQFKIEEG
jgi:hypothetical protein